MDESEQGAAMQPRRRKVGTGDAVPKAEPEKSQFPVPWGVVINDVFDFDVHSVFTRLTQELSLGDNATEWGSVLAAIDKSANNLFWAGKLARKAKLEDEAFAAKLGVRLEVLRTSAVHMLEKERAAGQRSKAPTLQDIDDKMLASWPDEVMAIRADKGKMHGAFRAIEALEVAWRERCQALRALSLQFRVSGT